jgi:molecular chaperone DnaK (HSP70)
MQWLLAVGGCLVVVSAIMAALGFRGREQIVGIDLGTTFSVVALRQQDKVTVLPDRITGRLLVPSVVTFAQNGWQLPVVGEEATALRGERPRSTIYNAKRFIGRTFDEVADDASNHRFVVAPNASGDADELPEDAAAGFIIPGNSTSERWISPIDVGAEVVKHLMSSVAHYLGYPIHRAVICVPAKFGSRETAATVKAFEKGGIKVMRVLEEPTAAAIAYNLHKVSAVRHVLVYDIGGGTLDTSLLYMNGKSVSVLGVAGDDHLGGSDFDHRMQSLLEAKLAKAAPEDAVPALPECTSSGLGVPSERAKIALSTELSTVVRCLASDGKARSMTVSREEFEAACKDLFERAVEPIKTVLSDQVMTQEHVDDVVLVGGASRMPQLRELLRRYFGDGKRLHTDIDPDVTVAYGAANIVD